VAALLTAPGVFGQVRRVVIIKVDGLGEDVLKRYLNQTNPATGKSGLPWIHRVFVERGAYLKNFYSRGVSLSVPSWSILDTGRHMIIRGNAEFDRTGGGVYDYMNFFPFYFSNARKGRADMPGVEVLDEAGLPLLIDSFQASQRLQGMQLYQRGVRWQTLKSTLPHRFSKSFRELFNEWQTGFELTQSVSDQVELELIGAIAGNQVLYLDYFFGDYDHVAHLANDDASQRQVVEKLDRLVGRIWTAIEASPLARETALVIVSDHGINSDPRVYSQGFNLLSFFASASGGGHHVMTNRYPESEYTLKGLDPFVSQVVTPSRDSLYLREEAEEYPTALLDLDGNERASVTLRNSDLNAIHLLMKEVRGGAPTSTRERAANTIISIVDAHRSGWAATKTQLDAELSALRRAIARRRAELVPAQKTFSEEDRREGAASASTRRKREADLWEHQLHAYTQYRDWLQAALSADAAGILLGKVRTEALVPKRAAMDRNTVQQLQNYVVNGGIDGFQRVNYFKLLTDLRVRNNVQPGVEPNPVDFVAVSIPAGALKQALSEDEQPDSDSIFIYSGEQRQTLILVRRASRSLRYLPVRNLAQDASGRITFERQDFVPGLPLRYFEDAALTCDGDRASWLAAWHTEDEWFRATHATQYSNGIIGLAEQFGPVEIGGRSSLWEGAGDDEPLLRKFVTRLRTMAAPDLLVLAGNHWNFNVRSYNPGGNHGSFFRASTHAVLMLAGAGIPAGVAVDRPYDSLSFVPALLALTGRGDPGAYPGPVIEETLPKRLPTTTAVRLQ
jgi:hypothetical protein